MNDLFLKALSFDDCELERIETEENELLERLNAHKLHDLDNIAFDSEGNIYALEDIKAGTDIVKNGFFYAKSKSNFNRGELIEL